MYRIFHKIDAIISTTTFCVFLFLGVASAQPGVSSLLDTEFQRINYKDFDLSLSQPSIQDRMMCKKWCGTKVITMVDTLDVQFNFDLHISTFYLNMNDKVFSLKSDFIKSFIIDGKTYINYRKPQATQAMILELMVEGKFVLYKHHNLIYQKPDFDPVLNVGNKVGTYKKSYEYYAFCDDRLIEISSKVKKTIKKLHQECGTQKKLKSKGDLVDLFYVLNDID